jgi:hypothetical protein
VCFVRLTAAIAFINCQECSDDVCSCAGIVSVSSCVAVMIEEYRRIIPVPLYFISSHVLVLCGCCFILRRVAAESRGKQNWTGIMPLLVRTQKTKLMKTGHFISTNAAAFLGVVFPLVSRSKEFQESSKSSLVQCHQDANINKAVLSSRNPLDWRA